MSMADAVSRKVTVLQPVSLKKNSTISENFLRFFKNSPTEHLQTAVPEGRSLALFSLEHLKSKIHFLSQLDVLIHILCKT